MPMPPEVAKVRELLRGLPIGDQLGAMLVAIIEDNPDAFNVSRRMLGATAMLSKGLSSEHRFKISELMRDHADELERPRVMQIES